MEFEVQLEGCVVWETHTSVSESSTREGESFKVSTVHIHLFFLFLAS